MSLFETAIVIPAFNEAKRLPATLDCLAKLCAEGALKPLLIREVLVVDDGSADNTKEVAASYRDRLPGLQVVDSGRNFGKGHAVRLGLSQAQTPWVLVADADMSTPWPEAEKLANACSSQNADIAIASRDMPESQITQHQSFIRENLGKSFNIFLRTITGLPFHDTQCGFKLINREKAGAFLRELSVDRFAWDVEFLIYARDFGLKTVEVPVVWEHKEASRVRVFRDGFEMLFSVVKVRFKSNFARRRLNPANR